MTCMANTNQIMSPHWGRTRCFLKALRGLEKKKKKKKKKKRKRLPWLSYSMSTAQDHRPLSFMTAVIPLGSWSGAAPPRLQCDLLPC